MRHTILAHIPLLLVALFPLHSVAETPPPQASPAQIPQDIQQSIRERVDNGYNTAIIVGVLNPRGRQYFTYGRIHLPDGSPANEHTLFEIGSATKVFTTLLLAQLAQQNYLNLDDPIQRFLPPTVKAPTRENQTITLNHLATHTSALPRLPDNLNPADTSNPYADYTAQKLYDFLNTHQLTGDIGQKYEYSNLGMGLLGHLLARHQNVSYEQLIKKHITGPLDMRDTTIILTPEMKSRLAPGHRGRTEVPNWDFTTLAPAGALRSTAHDLLTFLAVNLSLTESHLRPAITQTHQPQHPTDTPNIQVALGWHVTTQNNRTVHWHNGGTGGYHAFIGFDRTAQTALVILTNTAQSIDDLGFHFFDPSAALNDFSTPARPDPVTEIPLQPGETLPPGPELIEKQIEAIGGRDALTQIESRLIHASLQLESMGFPLTGTVTAYQARPDKFLIKTQIANLYTIEQAHDGQTAWELHSMTLAQSTPAARLITGPEKQTLLLALNFDMTNYQQLFQSVQSTAKALVEGQPCYKLILTPKSNTPPITLYLATDTNLPLKTDCTIKQNNSNIDVETWTTDYRPIDNILYPHLTRELAMGVLTHTRIDSIQHNITPDPNQFTPPHQIKTEMD